ncbi:hypothetical protein E2R68_03960 [Psychromonas sp. RZ22]|uniref:hypothetical protein n=1 Tax=Psychromonas algarum TaxID=2555643 RepID=UPI001068587B|nr:hypothetical protein [Psychromonas sp. RZ22]TEW55551.1 hypothetical protein E2R68_03960 [Psychromonas sp. RZ22]
MKKVYLALSVAALLTGCVSTAPTKTVATATNVQAVTASENLITDPQFTLFRKNKGESDAWVKLTEKDKGIGDAGSSGTTAFGPEGSVRFRFKNATDDFTAQPGVIQTVKGLQANTDYELSLYYNDKKGQGSPSQLIYGVQDLAGKSIATKEVHINDLENAPKGVSDKRFRQTFISFNSGSNTEVKVYAKLNITDPSRIKMDGNIGSQTEVRLDEVILIKE